MFKEVFIANHQRGLRFREGFFVAPLPPGRYTVFNPSWDPEHERIEVVDTEEVRFDHPRLSELLADGELRAELLVVDVAQSQRGRVLRDGKLVAVLPVGRHALWRVSGDVKVAIEPMAEELVRA